jgi:hypothetical protein
VVRTRDLRSWLRAIVGVFVGIYTAVQAVGFPSNLLIWWRCWYRGGSDCDPIRQAISELPSTYLSLDVWRIFNVALFLLCVALILPSSAWKAFWSKRGATARTSYAPCDDKHAADDTLDALLRFRSEGQSILASLQPSPMSGSGSFTLRAKRLAGKSVDVKAWRRRARNVMLAARVQQFEIDEFYSVRQLSTLENWAQALLDTLSVIIKRRMRD